MLEDKALQALVQHIYYIKRRRPKLVGNDYQQLTNPTLNTVTDHLTPAQASMVIRKGKPLFAYYDVENHTFKVTTQDILNTGTLKFTYDAPTDILRDHYLLGNAALYQFYSICLEQSDIDKYGEDNAPLACANYMEYHDWAEEHLPEDEAFDNYFDELDRELGLHHGVSYIVS